MLKRPTAEESEEDLLEFQRQFLAEKKQPSAAVVTKPGDKRKSGSPVTATVTGTSQRDVVHMEGLSVLSTSSISKKFKRKNT